LARNTKLKALIVDDEYPAREQLRHLLRNFEEVEVIGEAANAQEAWHLARAINYSVVFLDINMPGLNGLELARQLKQLDGPPQVIFTTAHNDFALQAFELDAADYLLKPFDEERLGKALARASRLARAHGGLPAPVPPAATTGGGAAELGRIPVENRGKMMLVDEADIVYACSEDAYVFVKLFKEKVLTRYTLKELEGRLRRRNFFRAHRQYLVNLKKVREIVPYFKGSFALVMDDADRTEVPVSRAQAKALRKVLGL